jgi:hypothetical protein
MIRFSRLAASAVSALVLLMLLPGAVDAQRRAVPRDHPPHPRPSVVVRGQVFIGGYFYDPVFGPYPWWPRTAYPYWYVPVYDHRADIRLHVEPNAAEEAAVYVDGFYAGIVDDFNGVFQSLPLAPGAHRIALYLEGYRTVHRNVYLRPGSTFHLRETMLRLPAGETSERPDVALPVPPPPAGSYRTPVTPPRATPSATPARTTAAGYGTLDLFVQPANAEVTIDGQRWLSTEEGHFAVQVPCGTHHVEARKEGHRTFAMDLEIREGEDRLLNVSLMAGTP